jgi:hypothetical protein
MLRLVFAQGVAQGRFSGVLLGGRFGVSVEAPDAETAIKIAIEQFEISDPERQRRLIARRIGV